MNRLERFFILLTLVALPVAQAESYAQTDQRQREVRDFTTARGLYNDGLYPLAAEQFEAFLAKYPESRLAPQAQFLLAEALFQQKKYGDAIREYRKLLRRYAAVELRDRASFRIGQALYYRDRPEEAVHQLQRFLD